MPHKIVIRWFSTKRNMWYTNTFYDKDKYDARIIFLNLKNIQWKLLLDELSK